MSQRKKKFPTIVEHTRKSERLMYVKTKNIKRPGKHPEDPFVLIEEDTSEQPMNKRGMEYWEEIH